MMHRYKVISCLILNVIFFFSCNVAPDKSKLTGNDYRLFGDTPLWDLAKAVRDENTEKIKRLIKEEKVDMNYQELKFGKTLLMLTVNNYHYNSCKTLLELGADPNKHSSYDGTSAIIEASGIEKFQSDNTQFLKLLLAHGANPNDEETGARQEGNTTRNTPLMKACSDVFEGVSPLEKVKVLVEAGANINHKNEYKWFPLSLALVGGHFDVGLYLLQKGANYNDMFFDRSEFQKNGEKVYLVDMLRESLLPLDSEKYQQKMAIVEFLKQQGIDYRKLPIPESVKSQAKKIYPNKWEEYLDKY